MLSLTNYVFLANLKRPSKALDWTSNPTDDYGFFTTHIGSNLVPKTRVRAFTLV